MKLQNILLEDCWNGYTQIGMKEKDGKKVPNCVPVKESIMCNECALTMLKSLRESTLTEAEYQGRTVTLNKPSRGDVAKYKVYVTNDKGNVIKVNFGDKNMSIKRDNPDRKKSFRARHKCDQKKDKTTAGYWSCKMWSSTPVSQILKGK